MTKNRLLNLNLDPLHRGDFKRSPFAFYEGKCRLASENFDFISKNLVIENSRVKENFGNLTHVANASQILSSPLHKVYCQDCINAIKTPQSNVHRSMLKRHNH